MDPSTSEQSQLLSNFRELLLEDDLDGFFDIVDSLFSEDESLSDPADSLCELAMDKYPNVLSIKLAQAINISPDTQTRIRCSTLFSRFLALKSPFIHQMINQRLKDFFLQRLQDEEEWEVLKIHCTCVSSIAARLFPKEDWPELLVLMLEWLSSPNSTLTRLATVVLLYELIPECPNTFSPYADPISLGFQRLMDEGCEDNTARIATVGAAAKFILHLAIPSNYEGCEDNQYYGLLPGMISVLGGSVYDHDLACKALDAMTILVKAKPRFFTLVHMTKLAEAMLKIASHTNTNSNENMRQLAVNFFIAVGEGGDEGKGMIQSLPGNVIEKLLTQLLQMLMCVEDDDVSWNEADVYDRDVGKMTMCCYAEDALSRLAIVLGGDVVVRNSSDLLPGFFKDADWKKRYAAVVSLGLVASGCSEMLVQYLEESVEKQMALVRDKHPRVRWAAIYAISEFSKYLSPYFQEQCHEQVIPALLQGMDDFGNPRVQTYAAWTMSNFCKNCCSNILKPHLKEIISKLLMFLQTGNTLLNETALSGLASLADSTKDDFRPFYPMVMPYLKVILIKETSNCMLVAKTLECITSIATAVGKVVFSTDVQEIFNALLSEHNRGDIDGQVKCYLLQAWGLLCKSLAEDFRPYLSASMPLLIKSAEREEHLKDILGNFEERSIILKEMLWACNIISCFAVHIKGGLHLWIEEVLNVVIELVNFKFDEKVRVAAISGFFKDADWKKRYAAVVSLGLVASGCSEMLVQYLEESVEKQMALVRDKHPRVRWAAIYAISEFSKYLSPYFQEQCYEQVIPALLQGMDDFGNPRVEIYAAWTMSNFCKNCCSNILKPYMKKIITKLLMFLQAGKTLKETALSGLASLADSTKDDFQPFYPMVMPYLKVILIKETSNRMLVAKTLVCITSIGMAVGKVVFSTDVEKIFSVLLSEHNRAKMDGHGQVKCYLLQAWGKICISLGEDFCPYLKDSMPLLIASARLEDHLKNNLGNLKQRSIILKEMLWACNTICCFAIHIKEGLHLWIYKVSKVVIRLVNFKFDEKVRLAAISVMPLLLRSAANAVENELPIPRFLDSPIIDLAKMIIPALGEALLAPTIKVQVQALVALNETMQIASTWAPDQKEIIDTILKVLSACFTRKKERENMAKYRLDVRKPEVVKEEIQEEQKFFREVRICVQILLKRLYARNLIPTVLYVKRMWEKDITPEERRMALNIFSDIAELCREHGLRLYPEYIPLLFEDCNNANPDIQQIAASAIGIYAEFDDREAFKEHIQDGLSSLEAIFQHPSEGGLDHSMAKDAAVCAYGKLCFFFCEEINSYQNIDLWLFQLPLKCNFEEAKAAHGLLCSMVDKPETRVTGPEDSYISRIITIMAEVLRFGGNIATEETKIKMTEQLWMFSQKLGDKFVAICKALPPGLQNTLRTYLEIQLTGEHECNA